MTRKMTSVQAVETSVTKKQFFLELPSPGLSHYTNYLHFAVKTRPLLYKNDSVKFHRKNLQVIRY